MGKIKSKLFAAQFDAACTPKADALCPLCERPIPDGHLDKHHLIPRVKGGKETEALHTACHRQIHAVLSNRELETRYNTVEALLTQPDILKFVTWIKTKPNDFLPAFTPKHH
jgi:5-methylcytosine-specific restriction endonuclease McrA